MQFRSHPLSSTDHSTIQSSCSCRTPLLNVGPNVNFTRARSAAHKSPLCPERCAHLCCARLQPKQVRRTGVTTLGALCSLSLSRDSNDKRFGLTPVFRSTVVGIVYGSDRSKCACFVHFLCILLACTRRHRNYFLFGSKLHII